jgi:hypothetical protein
MEDVMAGEFTLQIPSMRATQRVELIPGNKVDVANAIAPLVEHLVSAAGMQLSAAELAELRQAFIERGTISIPPTPASASSTISVEANSLNYSKDVAPRTP